MKVLIVGGGIGGLTAALSLHAAGVDCEVVESVVVPRPLGVGINLQPHAVRELVELGLGEALADLGIPTSRMVYTDRFGGTIVAIPRGRFAGYDWPQYSIHRGELQMMLLERVRERLGGISTGLVLEDFEQGDAGVTALLRDVRTGERVPRTGDVLVGADGLHSTVRAQLHPGDGPLLWSGIRVWRGTVEGESYLNGATMLVAGSNRSVKFVVYPVSARAARAQGRALLNWVAEVTLAAPGPVPDADLSRRGRLEDVLPHFGGWRLTSPDIASIISGTERILEHPMVDKDPLPSWGTGRVTLLGDAAHPMYPVGSNGGSQAVVDARVLARELAVAADPVAGLAAYEAERRPATSELVLAQRELPMEATIALVTERAPEGFDDITDVLTPDELGTMREAQRRLSDMDVHALNSRPSWNVVRQNV
ncbi:2-polyprenyl-6-methoxyphenol hydroxylase [Actinopolymorpha cephalotaxi]|uniref:2-polyprenyl-6-methoxyphenol hydroxylase n=1 Tax=Actinopolymorpha cephalotaxi TaxID=504797 RepID=A0A1I2LBN5_9ACTN|nr:flavin-dependent oxidoreductase [Actinopolymorpha cephalotaxi]NYH84963.1 2-polyprenyl-6-methoxyphenol hydroxylase-like FAD-dependent oxidoreductase [Actinopolymorpha cephalotaxi]SFF76802.1 2-polyprenyl-6-methoxyphenol hydroxylase [Actinopolymorpha cephalotaxi]